MSVISALAIYFITWWVCLFIVLPWGIRSHHESGVGVEEGHDAGAPVRPMLLRKMLVTTILATIVFGLIYGQMTRGWIQFEDIPILNGMPKPGA